jgi:hypothetical protein
VSGIPFGGCPGFQIPGFSRISRISAADFHDLHDFFDDFPRRVVLHPFRGIFDQPQPLQSMNDKKMQLQSIFSLTQRQHATYCDVVKGGSKWLKRAANKQFPLKSYFINWVSGLARALYALGKIFGED